MKQKSENEVWTPVKGYEGSYEVSSFGNIKSLRKWNPTFQGRGFFRDEKILSPVVDLQGYAIVGLSNGNKKISKKIHRIVAESFISNTKNKPQVNHINGIRCDNRVSNLEWVTHGENQKHSYEKLGKVSWFKGLQPDEIPSSKSVVCENFGIKFNSAKEAGEFFGYTRHSMSKFCNGVRDEKFGLSFRYA